MHEAQQSPTQKDQSVDATSYRSSSSSYVYLQTKKTQGLLLHARERRSKPSIMTPINATRRNTATDRKAGAGWGKIARQIMKRGGAGNANGVDLATSSMTIDYDYTQPSLEGALVTSFGLEWVDRIRTTWTCWRTRCSKRGSHDSSYDRPLIRRISKTRARIFSTLSTPGHE